MTFFAEYLFKTENLNFLLFLPVPNADISKSFLKQLLFRSSETVVWITPEGSYTLLEKFWRISQYLTGESIAKLSVTKKFFK